MHDKPLSPTVVRLLGFAAAILFTVTAVQTFAGTQLTLPSRPSPFFAYPVFVATFVGWIWMLLKSDRSQNPERNRTQ